MSERERAVLPYGRQLHTAPRSSPLTLQHALPPTRRIHRTLHKLVPALPTGDYSGLRRRILSLPIDPYQSLRETNEPVSIAVDSTGIKVQKAGGWIERKHGKKKRYVKLHFAVRVDTHEVVAMEVSTDDVHDVKRLSPFNVDLEEVIIARDLVEVYEK
jgi:hypothetical protein